MLQGIVRYRGSADQQLGLETGVMLLPGARYLLDEQANRDNSRWADFKLKSPAKLHPPRDNLIRTAPPVSAIKQRWLLRPIGFATASAHNGMAVFPL
jgi:hypothetical protein